jgi:hypothetical protein
MSGSHIGTTPLISRAAICVGWISLVMWLGIDLL